ncbi:thermonuclease family protein [Mycoplasma miroungirhinis]|uniref:TNase-like domain-containing protein n=1 Tax=Mycoplasma miroungirhinis TaxID=754516 RepID=A0A6M4JHN4_9MOLU|nr:thermonuclease family protein [Mycoplasma miroungirhinis]QJR43931.1 hypothetical protein HLA92_00495 [Mycoplasma miroungirhinis]
MKNKKLIIKFIFFLSYLFLSTTFVSCYFNNNIQTIKNNSHYSLTKEKIIEVIDGDTLKTSKNELIRLQGIDTPESRRKINNNWHLTKGLENSWALKAKNFLKELIFKNDSTIYIDHKFQTYDRYKRTVTQIFDLNQNSINLKIIKNGLARVNYISLNFKSIYYTKNKEYYFQLLNVEQKARQSKAGFWAQVDKIDQIFKTKTIKI